MNHEIGISKVAALTAAVGTTAGAWATNWPGQAQSILVGGGVLVTGSLTILSVIDHYRIKRRQEWDEANKESLSSQLALAKEARDAQVASIKDLRDRAAVAEGENAALRAQHIELSKRLFETDIALHDLRMGMAAGQTQADSQGGRLDKLENP